MEHELRGAWRKILKWRATKGHIDVATANRFAGWALAGQKPVAMVEALIGGKRVASAVPHIDRPDIANTYPGRANLAQSGFILEIPEDELPRGRIFHIDVVASSPGHRRTHLGRFTRAGADVVRRLADASEAGVVGPFPRQVIDIVASEWPDACTDFSSASGQRAFVTRLGEIFRTQELRSLPAMASYARYLRICWAHCAFVESFFPAENMTAAGQGADFHSKPNSVFEIFAIIHQLYVLKSYDLDGEFAEFGCFKGFSSAMLSFACNQLGLRMHIFDSFEGLPPAAGSTYEAGQYCGSLDEVWSNVTRFGVVDCVEFHRGFFKDTFETYRPPNLLCLWMDVDLEVSARDLMVVADRLDPRATLFSHESTADIFAADGMIVTTPDPDNPIPPMLDRFEQLGRPLTGRFVRGNTGAFWPRAGGVPVLDNDVLLGLVKIINEA